MAEKLLQYYKYVAEELGIPGKMQLAIATKLPSTKAAMAPDSPENLEMFQKALAELTGKPAPKL